jgi:hypothetical protein
MRMKYQRKAPPTKPKIVGKTALSRAVS